MRFLSILVIDHCAVISVPVFSKGDVHGVFFPGWVSSHQPMINFLDGSILKLRVQVSMRFCGPSQHQDSRGFAIQTMNDPYTPILYIHDGTNVWFGRIVTVRQGEQPRGFIQDDDGLVSPEHV